MSINEEIAKAISKEMPFSSGEIYYLICRYNSVDIVIRAIEYCRVSGCTSLQFAIDAEMDLTKGLQK